MIFKKIRQKYLCICTLALLLLIGCDSAKQDLNIEISNNTNPWTNLNFANDPAEFQFAIVSDLTGGYHPPTFEQAVQKINLLKPEFVMSIGDLIEGGKLAKSENAEGKMVPDPKKVNAQWNQFDSWLQPLKAPFFYVPGNHDIMNATMKKVWKQRLGKSYYHFVYKNTLFLCINTQDPQLYGITDNQIEYLEQTLRQNKNVRWTLLFMHRPLWTYLNRKSKSKGHYLKTIENYEKLEQLLADRPYTVFAGHNHAYSKTVRNNRNHYVLSSTGAGGGSTKLPIEQRLAPENKGRFYHIMWVTMTDQGPVVANLMLDAILDDEAKK